MAVDNQKLFSQMADLGRNINLLNENVKKNTSAIESMSSVKDKEGAKGTDDKKISDALNSLDKTLKEIQKSLSTKPTETAKVAPSQEGSKITEGAPKSTNTPSNPNEKKEKFDMKDFNKIAGGLVKNVVRAFQEGGVAPKTGNYLVGENGPEIVALPKGSGVIPLDLKDLMKGIAKVPELSEVIKENTKAGVLGSWGGELIVTEDGKKINLDSLMEVYEEQYDKLKDEKADAKVIQEVVDKMNAIYDLHEKTGEVSNSSIEDVNSQRKDILAKLAKDYTDKDQEYVASTRDKIINSTDKSDVNSYTLAKAHLMATQMLLEKKEKEASMKDEFDKLGKLEDKTSEVVSPKIEDIKKQTEKPKDTDEAKEEKKSGGLLSKIGLKKKEKGKEEEKENEKEPTAEKKSGKESEVLSKAGKFAETVASGVAAKVIGTNLPGVGGVLAKKGLNALKSLSKKGRNETGEGGEGPTGDGKKGETAGTKNLSEMKEIKPALAKSEAANITKENKEGSTALKTDVKKLSPQPKTAETKKEAEPPKPKEPPKLAEEKPKSSSEASITTSSSSSKGGGGRGDTAVQSSLGTSKDIDDIKSALSRIASILEGPLTVSPIDPPFRPDSRRL